MTAVEMKSENEASTGGAAENHVEIDRPRGSTDKEGGAEMIVEIERRAGPSRYIDHDTELLGSLAAMWQDFQQFRKAADQRGLATPDVEVLLKSEEHFAKALKKALRKHPLWPWLSEHPGTGGVHAARLIARIGNPHRFPGQQCDRGHTFAPILVVRSTLSMACPFLDTKTKEACPGRVLPPRTTTGVRALWRYFGLDGDRDTAASGHRYDRLGKTALLQPEGGIADQIVRLRIEPWRSVYDSHHARLMDERDVVDKNGEPIRTETGADRTDETEHDLGSNTEETKAEHPDEIDPALGLHQGTEADHPDEIDRTLGIRLFQIDAIARKIAAKAFVGDLLTTWKRITKEDTE